MSGPEDPRPGYDWATYRAARERFFALVRPEAMQDPPAPLPDTVPQEWTAERREPPPGHPGSRHPD